MEIFRSVCPYDCPDSCGLLVHVENGTAVKIQGDPDHPFTRGTLCRKMSHYEKTVHSPRRILKPLKRCGPKGNGDFKEISWEEAIERIKNHWELVIARYGAEAILPYSYAGTMGLVQRQAGHPFFYHLGASRLERTICAPAKGYGWRTVMGQTWAPHPGEIHHSDLIILWGIHALATDIHIMHDIRLARKQGAKVWLIDTYETPTAKIADRMIIVRPGTDGALALGMMAVIAAEHLEDTSFIAKYVQGYEAFKAEILPDYPPEKVSEITGLPVEVISELARGYAKARAPFIRMGSGLSRYSNGAMTVRTIVCLPAVVGAWAKLGGGLLTGTSPGRIFATQMITREDFLKQPSRIINMNQLGHALNELTDPPIMSLYVYASNPAAVAPDQNQVLKGLAREDLFTVVHERFMTDTARYADIVLPATTSLEHSDIYCAYGHYGIQRAYAVIPPVGQAKSNWEVFGLLAKALGMKEPFFEQSPDDLIDTLLAQASSNFSRNQWEQLRQGKPIELRLADGYKTRYETASGKIEIFSPQEEQPLPKYVQPHGDNAPFWLINSPDGRLLNSSFNERDDLTGTDKMLLKINPDDAVNLGLKDGQRVIAYNQRGEAMFISKLTAKIPRGIVVSEGVWWLEHVPGRRSINALTSQRLTDRAKGSTFYDVQVHLRTAEE